MNLNWARRWGGAGGGELTTDCVSNGRGWEAGVQSPRALIDQQGMGAMGDGELVHNSGARG